MSGRNNIVPMPTAAAPAPMAYPWPMPPGGFPAGCCPPGGMDALLQCYCDIQAATAFISKVVQDLAANDPAFQQSLVDAIAASGSNIPLIGVTNGSDAQPGQVGEFVPIMQNVPYTAAAQTQTVSMGILQPGDWDVWGFADPSNYVNDIGFNLAPVPVGFSNDMKAIIAPNILGAWRVVSPVVRASLTVPTLMVFSFQTNATGTGSGAGTAEFWVYARRVR